MYWATFLHIYQPPNQMEDILERIVNESYRPLFRGFLKRPSLKFTLNINAGLTEQLDEHGYGDVLETIQQLVNRKQCELTESAKYHPFLPNTPDDEIRRQIKLNHETNTHFFGKAFQPEGFFPPEMAYDRPVADILAELPYKWLLLDEIAIPSGKSFTRNIPTITGTSLKVFFRNRRISNFMMSGTVRTVKSLKSALGKDMPNDGYILTAMDGETFGHHRAGLEQILFRFLESIETAHIKDLYDALPDGGNIEPRPSTWAASEDDIQQGKQFLSWDDPSNKIHKMQWAFTRWVTSYVHALPSDPTFQPLRHKLDEALHSCQYWWASAKPWWSIEMIEAGAFRLKDIILSNPNRTPADAKRAENYYSTIVLTAFEWQRTGYIRKHEKERGRKTRIPLKQKHKEKSDVAGYEGTLALLRRQMERAARDEEFEQAILWRDAILKLERNLDIYDTLHVTDLLRTKIPEEEIQTFLNGYRKDYERIRSGQPEQRD